MTHSAPERDFPNPLPAHKTQNVQSSREIEAPGVPGASCSGRAQKCRQLLPRACNSVGVRVLRIDVRSSLDSPLSEEARELVGCIPCYLLQ